MKVLTVFGTCFLLLFALWWSCTESYFPLYPLIDTRLPQGFSEQKFKQITPGMSKTEVAAMLPGSPESDSTQWRESYWFYGNDGGCYVCDLAWVGFEIQFDEAGNVITTKRSIFMD